MGRGNKFRALLACGTGACAAAVLLSLSLGSTFISLFDLWRPDAGLMRNIVLYARLPRTVGALSSGAALAVAGAALQNVLANKLASPSIIGVNAGAGLGVTLCCACGTISGFFFSASAFLGSLSAVFLISLFAKGTNASRTTVILGGVALNSILNAASESISVLDPDVAALSAEFRVGGFHAVSYTRLLPAVALIALSLLLLFTLFNELDVLSLGDDTAQGVGLPVKRYRVLFLVLCALLAGSAVSFSGMLGFVGLIVPHGVRSVIGNESRHLLPLCAVFGGVFVLLCDLAARLVFAPFELPVGIITSIIGGPLFVVILVKSKGGRRFD